MRSTIAILALLSGAPLAVAQQPASRPALVAAIKSNLADVRVQIICFDHDQQQMDRTVDVQVTDDEGGAHSAEGLMSVPQAMRVIDALAANGFFDRAAAPGTRPWSPPPQPFYAVNVQLNHDKSLIETRAIDATLLDLLVHVRDGLGRTAAGKSADKVVTLIDPKLRRWPPSGPTSQPKPPALPGGTSPVHLDYTFLPIDPTWKVEEVFLKPAHGQFVSSFKRIDAEDDFTGFFRDLEYLKGDEQREAKHVICYPSGAVYCEIDSHLYGVDLPRGDAYERIFDPAGKLIYYSHAKDGREADAISSGPENKSQRVIDGHGFVRRPTFDPNFYSILWYHDGLVFVERSLNGATCVSTTLRNDGAELMIGQDNSETMFEGNFQWHKSAAGEVTRGALYSAGRPASQPAELRDHYQQVRRRFDAEMLARLQAAGYSAREIGIDNLLGP